MEKRAFKRIPSDIAAHFYCNDSDYSATVTNVSENGMYLQINEVFFPLESLLDIFISVKDTLLKIPVKVCRLTKSKEIFDGMGVKVLHPVPEFIDLVMKLKMSSKILS